MLYKIYIILILFTFSTTPVFSANQTNYGHFNLVVKKLETCKGPKKRDCGVYSMKLNGRTGINFDFQMTENMSPTKAKVLAISNGNEMLRLQITKPCDNIFVKPLLASLFNISNNCIIKKSHYKFTLDFEEVLRKYYGGMHLFGDWAFRSQFYGDSCNLSCTHIGVQISGDK